MCYLLKRERKELWLRLFFGVSLLPVMNLAFYLIHFKSKE